MQRRMREVKEPMRETPIGTAAEPKPACGVGGE
jgi:hypothetical protein